MMHNRLLTWCARSRTRRAVLLAGLTVVTVVGVGTTLPRLSAQSSTIVISQVYGGGGNSGAPYTHDFIELFNRGTAPVSLGGWSVQYASATGTGNLGANSGQITELPDVVLAPGSYYLIQEASQAAVGASVPNPDTVDGTPINLSGSAGKIALVSASNPLGCNGGATPCSAAQLALIVDLVGYGGANFFEGTAAAPVLSNTTAAFRLSNGCADTNQNGTDFAAAAPAPRNTAITPSPCAGAPDAAPAVTSTAPTAGETAVPVDSTISVTFSETVNLNAGAISVACPSGTPVAVSSAATQVTSVVLTPVSPLPSSTSCVISVNATEISDADLVDPPDVLVGSASITFTTAATGPACEQPFTPTFGIQGSGSAAAITGMVTTQGVVVGDYEGPSPALRGFYIQDAVGDAEAATSDGLFVFNGDSDSVQLGDVVRVTGVAGDFQDQTQVSTQVLGGSTIVCETGATVPSVDVTLPFASATFPERFEGMLIRLPQDLSVTEHFQLGRFGQVVVSSSGRLQQPTDVSTPGAAALTMQEANNRNRLIIDDGLQNQNPDPVVFGRNGDPVSAVNTLRGGDTATGIVGVMTYTWAGNAASGNAYRVRPVGALGGFVRFEAVNARPTAAPARTGSLRVASMNLLNFFNTFDGLPDSVDNCLFGLGGPPADCRGADTQAEFDRQWSKTVRAIHGSDADIVGVIEIENDGYGADSAIQFLVNRLNDEAAPGTYGFIDADAGSGQVNALGTDAIKVGLIYRVDSVAPIGQTAVLNSVAFVNGGDSGPRNRPALAQAFEELATGARFVIAVNHFKSKGSGCDAPDAGDGQGNCNAVRVAAANELGAWLATDPTGINDPDVLVVGDLNAYSREDPLTALEARGFTNLMRTPGSYSYVFDGQWGSLDHALASATLNTQVTGAEVWPINADEPSILDYNMDFKSACQIGAPLACADPASHPSLYAADEFRIADHSPVLIDFDLNAPVPVTALARAAGYIVLSNSGGLKAGDSGSRLAFAMHARIGRGSTRPSGSINVLLRRTESGGVRYYLVTAGNVATLATNPASGRATLTAQARIWDVTRPLFPRLVELNGSVTVRMDDNGLPVGLSDTLGITVLNRQGVLWFSSHWTGTATVEQPIDRGNATVR